MLIHPESPDSPRFRPWCQHHGVLACPDLGGVRLRELAGLPLLHLGHPDWPGQAAHQGRVRPVCVGLALIVLMPRLVVIALAIFAANRGQVDAEQHRMRPEALNEALGVLFKMRRDNHPAGRGASHCYTSTTRSLPGASR